MYSVAWPLTVHAMNATFAAMALFMFSMENEIAYEGIGGANDGGAVFDVERLSDEEPEESEEEEE